MIEDNTENASMKKKTKNSLTVSVKLPVKVSFCQSKSVKMIFTPLDRKCNVEPLRKILTNTFDQF